MYWNVPTIAPSAVSGEATVGCCVSAPIVAPLALTGPPMPDARARPKSMSFAPERVISDVASA